MAQYINKDALVAEIDRRLDQLTDAAFDSMIGRNLIEIKDFLDSIEVKDVDFETELDRIWFDNRLGESFDNRAVDFARIRMLCKHFFELGLKAQKRE